MRRGHVFLEARDAVSVGVARGLTPLLLVAPVAVAALLVALAWETGSWRPVVLAAVLVAGTAPFNAILLAGLVRGRGRSH